MTYLTDEEETDAEIMQQHPEAVFPVNLPTQPRKGGLEAIGPIVMRVLSEIGDGQIPDDFLPGKTLRPEGEMDVPETFARDDDDEPFED